MYVTVTLDVDKDQFESEDIANEIFQEIEYNTPYRVESVEIEEE